MRSGGIERPIQPDADTITASNPSTRRRPSFESVNKLRTTVIVNHIYILSNSRPLVGAPYL